MTKRPSWIRSLFESATCTARRGTPSKQLRNRKLGLEQLEVRAVPATLVLNSGIASYAAGAGVNNSITVSISGSNLQFNDTAETIDASSFGIAATGSGTNTVTIPTTGVTGVSLQLGDGADTIAAGGVSVGAVPLAISQTGTLLTIAGPLTIANSAIQISAVNAISLSSAISSGTGLVSIAANTDATGTDGFTEDATLGSITTTSTNATAVSIVVNTSGGGTGNASICAITTATAGGVVVSSNGGSILYSGTTALTASQQGTTNGGSTPSGFIGAKTISLTATGAGSVGTAARPIQTVVGSTSSKVTVSAGDGGDYLVDWSGNNLTLAGAVATGPGNILVVTANSGGHNLILSGNVSAVSGSIFLGCDDTFTVNAGVVIGGPGFSGAVWMQANRDQGTAGQSLTMNATSSIQTTNNTNVSTTTRTPATQAVYLDISGDQGTPSNLTVANIKVGNGGRIVINAIPNGIAAEAGKIINASASDTLDAGPTGTIDFTVGISAVAVADAIGTSAIPLNVVGGAVLVNDNYGNDCINGAGATTFSQAMTASVAGQAGTPASFFSTTNGPLTLSGAVVSIGGGTLNFASVGGPIVVNTVPGNGNTGQITFNAGANPVVYNAAYTLPATAAPSYTASGLQLNKTFTLAAGSSLNEPVQVNSGGVLNGFGAITGAVTVSGGGQISLGTTVNGILSTAGLMLNPSAVVNISATGAVVAGSDYGQIESSGPVTLGGATLSFNPSFLSNGGDTFTILRNDSSASVSGTFSGLADGSLLTAFAQNYRISYEGGDGNDVVLTFIPPPIYYVEADGWAGQGSFSAGSTIPDADPVNSGNQSAIFGGTAAVAGSGFHAFTTVSAALSQITDDGAAAQGATLIINSGSYSDAVVGNSSVSLMIVQGGPVTFSSLASNVPGETIDLSGQGTTLTIGGDNASTEIDSPILGPGSLVKTGTGTVKLAAANTYAGATQIAAGTLSAGIAAAFSPASAVTVGAGGILSVNGLGVTIASLSGAGTVNDGATSAGTLTISSASGTTTFAGALQDGGSGTLGVVKAGASTQIFAGADTYTGPTSVSAGILQAGSNTAFGTASAITLGASGTFNLGGFGVGLASLAGTGKVGNGAATPATLTLGVGNSSLTYAGVIQDGSTGPLSVIKIGTAIVALNGTNIYTGGTIISQGEIQSSNVKGLGTGLVTFGDANTGAGNVAFRSTVTASSAIANNFVVSASAGGAVTLGTADNITKSPTITYSGSVTLNHDVTLRAGTSNTLFTGRITGTGNVIVTASSATNDVVFNQAAGVVSDFVGGVTIASGILQLGSSSDASNQYLPDAAVVNIANGATLSLSSGTNPSAETIGGLTGSGAIAQTNGTGPFTLTVGFGNATSTFTGAFAASKSTAFTLAKIGSGTLDLTQAAAGAVNEQVLGGSLLLDNASGSALGAGAATVGSQGTLGGVGSFTGPLVVSGVLSPGDPGSTGTLSTGNLSFTNGGVLAVSINGNVAGTSYDAVNSAGSVNLVGGTLKVFAGSGLNLNDTYTILAAASAPTGSFVNGSTITAVNNPLDVFGVAVVGNSVVLTLVSTGAASSSATLDVVGDMTIFDAPPGSNDNLTVSNAGGNMSITDGSVPITLTPAAVSAGWTASGAGVSNATSRVAGMAFNLGDGSDTIASLNAGTDNVALSGAGGLTIAGPVTTSGSIAFTDLTSLVVQGTVSASAITTNIPGSITSNASGNLGAPIVSLSAGRIGAAGNPVSVTATTVTANSAGDVNLVASSGATFNVTAQGAVNLSSVAGTLTLGGLTTSGGNIALSSGDAVVFAANLSAGNGTVTIAANTDGAGSTGFQTGAFSITTANISDNALSITVNTSAGGTGDATLGAITVGSNAGGTLTVDANRGNIVYAGSAANDSQLGLTNAGSAPSLVFSANNYVFTTTGDGAIGSDANPLQMTNFGVDGIAGGSNVTLSAGTGGAFLTDWGGVDLTIAGASAQGDGDIRVVTANAGGHNLFVTGNVSAVDGNIYLASDDNFAAGPNVVIGGPAFTGTVWMQANRDQGTAGQTSILDATDLIQTSNTTNIATTSRTPNTQAVYLDISGDAGTPSRLTVGSIQVGNGGRIVVNAIPNGIASEAGAITMGSTADVLDAGPNGTIQLIAGITNPAVADAIGTAAIPIRVAGGNVVLSDNFGNAFIVGNAATTISDVSTAAIAGQVGQGSLSASTTAGPLTISAAGIVNVGGAVNLSGAGGTVISGPLNAGTAPIGVTGDATVSGVTLSAMVAVSGKLSVASSGDLQVLGSSVGTLNATSFQSAGTLEFDVNGTGSGQFDQIVVASGTINLAGTNLVLNTNQNLDVGDSVTLIANATGNAVIGQFATGAVIASHNNPSQLFSINYAGGASGHDVVATLTQVSTTDLVDVTNGQLSFGGGPHLSNTLSIRDSGGIYAITDSASIINLTQAAKNAGFSGDGTNTITGPAAAVSNLILNTTDGNDSITLAGLQSPFTIVGGGQLGDSVTIAGVLSFTGNAVIGGVGSIVALPGSKIVAPTGTLSLSASGSIGDPNSRLATQVAAENVTAAGSVYLAEDDGLNLQANAGGALDVLNGSGTLTIGSAVTASGITLSSGDSIVLAADLNAGSGPILINANTDGVGSDGLSQTAGAIITTDTDISSAVIINVNTPSGGTGNASIDSTSIGNLPANQGGGLIVNSNGGSILFAGAGSFTASQQGTANGGSATTSTLQAGDFFFTATGAGSIGTDARPLQTTNFAGTAVNQSVFNLSAGDGGAFLTDWGPISVTVQGASATGPGNVRIVSANAAGHNMFVTGAVTAGSGSIYLAADDNMTITAPIGGGDFSGTVYIAGNRDLGNTVNLLLNAGSSIMTSNPGPSAVVLEGFNTNGTAAGGIVLNNITVGNGGTINVSTTPASVDVGGVMSGGFIDAFAPGVVLNAGPAGTIILSARPYTGGDAIDGGSAGTPLLVSAGTVDATSIPTLGNNGGVFISSNIATAFNVSIVGSSTLTGNIGLTTTSGTLTVAAPMQGVGGSAINLNGADGVVLAATLGGAATGTIGITGPLNGTGGIVLGAGNLTVTQNAASTYAGAISGTGGFFKAGSGTLTVTGANAYTGATSLAGGALVDDGSIVGTNNIATTGAGSIDGTGMLAPVGGIAANLNPGEPGGTGILNTGNLAFAPGGSLTVDLNNSAQAGVGYDQLNVTGSVSLASVPLVVNVTGSPALGASFVLVNNDGSDPVVGTFAGGATVVGTDAAGTLVYTFAINYAGGDGNDLVATLVEKDTFPLVDVNAATGLLSISDGNGTNNDLTTTITGGNYRIHDAVGAMSVTAAAAAAGWSVQGGDAIGPVAGITNIALHLGTGTDRIEGFAAGTASLAIDYAGSGLTIAGPIAETGNFTLAAGGSAGAFLDLESTVTASAGNITITGVGGVTAAASSKLIGNNITVLVAGDAGGIGTQGQPLLTDGSSISLGAGAGGIFLTQDIAASVAASSVNGGNVVLTNLVGTLTIAGPVTTTSGNITISSPDAVFVQANINAGSGTIAIAANADGNGVDGFTQSAGLISTTNTQLDAVTITVNQPSGGTGNASLDNVFVGPSATVGGTLVVSSNGGSILDSDPTTFDSFQTGVSGAGGTGPALLLQAQNYVFTAIGSGSIGTDAHPIQTQNIGSANEFSSSFGLTAGDGGVFLTDWGTTAVTLNNPLGGNAVSATGPGSIRVVAANAAGHNFFVAGSVTAAAGNIFLAADDKLMIAAPIGGAGFSGTVYLGANRDEGNAGQLDMSLGSITTTNASPSAALLEEYSSGASDSSIILGSITVGDGGTIAVTTAPASGPAASTGIIDAQDQSVLLNAGPTGTILLTARTFATEPAFEDAIGTFNGPLEVTAGKVVANVTATAANNGNIEITSSGSTSFVANVVGTATKTGSINLSTQAGTLTISGPSTAAGGVINLTGFAGVVLAADVGSATAGPISIVGALSGAGNLIAGTGAVTLNQNAASTYSGDISGNQLITLFANAPTDALTLAGANTYTGSTTVSSGSSLLVTGSLAATSGITVQFGATLGGSGAVGPVTNAGIINPGIPGSPGTLGVDNLTLGPGTLVLDLSGIAADSVNVTGAAVDITGSTLSLNVGMLAFDESFTILAVPGNSGGLTGTFVGLDGTAGHNTISAGGTVFTISYTGGDGNDITLTASGGTPATLVSTVLNGGIDYVRSTLASKQHSMVDNVVYSFSQIVNLSAANFTLSGFQGTPAALVPNVVVSGSGSVWTVTFSGVGVNGGTHSIGDGEYQLVLSGVPGLAPSTYDFFRLLGDMDGDGTVSASDFSTLISTFLRPTTDPLFLGADDFDGDHTIGASDLSQFTSNFLHTVPTPLPN